jgi:hypothetical protein
MQRPQTDLKALLPLEPYVSVLVDTYQDPIKATELAKRVGHTKAAVTKVRDRLLDLCDKDKMLFGHGFVLRNDLDTFVRSFIILALSGKHKRFMASKFVRIVLGPEIVHERLKSVIPFYDKHFTEADTGYMLRKILEIVENIDSEELRQLGKVALKQPSQFAGYVLALNLPRILQKIKFSIKDEHELELIYVLRDKIFYIVRDFLWALIEGMKILQTLDEEKKTEYKSVYKHTADFYLRQIMQTLDAQIAQAAKESNIKVKRPPAIGITPIAR